MPLYWHKRDNVRHGTYLPDNFNELGVTLERREVAAGFAPRRPPSPRFFLIAARPPHYPCDIFIRRMSIRALGWSEFITAVDRGEGRRLGERT